MHTQYASIKKLKLYLSWQKQAAMKLALWQREKTNVKPSSLVSLLLIATSFLSHLCYKELEKSGSLLLRIITIQSVMQEDH